MMQVEIITPRKIEFQEEADCLVLPTLSGEISILPNHAPLISVIIAGKIIVKNKGQESFFDTEGGVLEVLNNKVTILLKRF